MSIVAFVSWRYALKSKVVLSWSFRGKKILNQTKAHMMAIRAKVKNIKQDVLAIHLLNEDLLYLI